MYLGTALKLAIPFALRDREEMAEAYGYVGPEADAAKQACVQIRALRGIRPSTFSLDQRETARMTLLWSEQYLRGFMEAVVDSDLAEFNLAQKQRNQIHQVRVEHFGQTVLEASIKHCIAVPVGGDGDSEALWKVLPHVICSICGTRTNGATTGDTCRTCKKGVFMNAN